MYLSKKGILKKSLWGRSLPGRASKTTDMMNQAIAGKKEMNLIEDLRDLY
jgi:hypothetical protein